MKALSLFFKNLKDKVGLINKKEMIFKVFRELPLLVFNTFKWGVFSLGIVCLIAFAENNFDISLYILNSISSGVEGSNDFIYNLYKACLSMGLIFSFPRFLNRISPIEKDEIMKRLSSFKLFR